MFLSLSFLNPNSYLQPLLLLSLVIFGLEFLASCGMSKISSDPTTTWSVIVRSNNNVVCNSDRGKFQQPEI
ncbi:hypothetical protein Hdeb2414_s0182g00825761 [Helianthus debilis subsp. tardiflorus]